MKIHVCLHHPDFFHDEDFCDFSLEEAESSHALALEYKKKLGGEIILAFPDTPDHWLLIKGSVLVAQFYPSWEE